MAFYNNFARLVTRKHEIPMQETKEKKKEERIVEKGETSGSCFIGAPQLIGSGLCQGFLSHFLCLLLFIQKPLRHWPRVSRVERGNGEKRWEIEEIRMLLHCVVYMISRMVFQWFSFINYFHILPEW